MYNGKAVRVQYIPNLVSSENRICLTRIRWESGGRPGLDRGAYSAKLSISLCFVPEDFWVGAFWKTKSVHEPFTLWVCLIPFLPIRFKMVRAFGGIIP